MNGLTHLALFAGIGGFSLAAETAGFATVAHSEIDPVADAVHREFFPGSPNLGDICRIDWQRVRAAHGVPLVVSGGVPCQPASALGQMRGVDDERWLWPEFIRMARELGPGFVIAENPPSLVSLDDGRPWNGILAELAALGFDLWWDVFPGAAFGAGHLRERVLLFGANADNIDRRGRAGRQNGKKIDNDSIERRDAADAEGIGERVAAGKIIAFPNGASGEGQRRARSEFAGDDGGEALADVHGEGLQGYAGHGKSDGGSGSRGPITAPDLRGRVTGSDWWHEARTGVPVLVDGLPGKLVEAYSRCFGNAIVPQVAVPFFETIREMVSRNDATAATV